MSSQVLIKILSQTRKLLRKDMVSFFPGHPVRYLKKHTHTHKKTNLRNGFHSSRQLALGATAVSDD